MLYLLNWLEYNHDQDLSTLLAGRLKTINGKKVFNGKTRIHDLQMEGGDQDIIMKIRNGDIRHIEQTKIKKT